MKIKFSKSTNPVYSGAGYVFFLKRRISDPGPDFLILHSFKQPNFGVRRPLEHVTFLMFEKSIKGIDSILVRLFPRIDVHEFVIA